MKKKVFDIAGSNIEMLGSKVEKECKKAAAGEEKAWLDAGKKPGLQIWRIEKFKVKSWPKKSYGKFYDGDSYICLYTYKKPDTDKLAWDLHFWLGTDTTQDEAGTAAYKTVELDDYLGGGPVQYREVCGKETKAFLNYFTTYGGIQLLSGGAASGFNVVKPEEYEPRLLHLKGRNHVRITQVPLKTQSLTSGDAFVLDNGLTLYQFQGKNCNQKEKVRAAAYCRALDSERSGKPEVIVIDQGDKDIPKEFWELLGGEGNIRDDQGCDEAWETKSQKAMFQLTDAGGKLEFVPVAQGKNVSKSKLDTDDVFIIDVGSCVYVWIGKGSSSTEKKMGMSKAQHYLKEYKRPSWLPIVRILEGSENQVFNNDMASHKKAKKFQKSTGGSTIEQKGQMGCYLSHHDTSNGTLFLNWKHEELKGALAYFKPQKKVAAFKFKKAGGKEELTRETNNRKNYFEGWCNYVKLAKEYQSTIMYQTSEVYLYTHKGSKIEEMPRGCMLSLADVEAIAAVPGSKKVFEGVKTISRSLFLNQSQAAGAALTLPK